MDLIKSNNQVSQSVEDLLLDLEQIVPPFPTAETNLPLNLVDLLRNTARSGKAVRIQHFDLQLPIQSHFDHVRVLGPIADILCQDYLLNQNDKDFFSSMIGCHDLPEIVTRDEPIFTSAELKVHLPEPLLALNREEAIIFIRESLPESMRVKFELNMDRIERCDDLPARLFELCDKIEPIVAIWRYLRCYRDKIEINQFIEAMTDFFSNPGVLKVCLNEQQQDAVRFLQGKENAEAYFFQGINAFKGRDPKELALRLVTDVVERFDIVPVLS
jgi:5'-deoxynucleotidase YfbR-like HD superfamily hydrolase